MTIEEQKLKNLFKKRNASQSGWIDVFPAKLGKADGTILTDTVGIIYVRHVVNGQVYEVYNDGAPTDKFGLQVEVGRRIGEKELRIKSVRGVYNQPANPAVNVNTLLSELFIGRDRFLPFLVFPINGGGLVVNIYGDVFLKSDGTFGYVANQTLDLTSYVPASGAKFVLIEADDSGVIYVTTGTAVDSKELLTPSDIPAVTTGRIPSTAVRLYTGQTQLYRDPNSINDFVDVRSITAGGGGGGSGSFMDLTTNQTAAGIKRFSDSIRVGIDPPTAETDGSISQAQEGVSVGNFLWTWGTGFASFITGMFSRGTKASPTQALTGDIALRLRGRFHDGISYGGTSAEIRHVADETHDATGHGTRIEIWTTPIDSTTLTLVLTVHSDGTVSYPIKTSDPSSPIDGAMWLLRETTPGHADGEAMGPLGMTYTGDTETDQPLKLSVNDGGTTRRVQFV